MAVADVARCVDVMVDLAEEMQSATLLLEAMRLAEAHRRLEYGQKFKFTPAADNESASNKKNHRENRNLNEAAEDCASRAPQNRDSGVKDGGD